MSVPNFILVFLLLAVPAQALELPACQLRPDQSDRLELNESFGDILNAEDTSSPVQGMVLDLNGDDIQDFMVIPDRKFCGTGGCPLDIYDGNLSRPIGRVFGSPVFVFNERINGFPVLHVYSHASARSGSYSVYVFDGQAYQSVSTVFLSDQSLEDLFKKYTDVSLCDVGGNE